MREIRGPDADLLHEWIARQRARLTPLLRPVVGGDAGEAAQNVLRGRVLVAANRVHAARFRVDGQFGEADEHAAQADATEESIERIAALLDGRARRRFDKLTTLPDLDITAAHE